MTPTAAKKMLLDHVKKPIGEASALAPVYTSIISNSSDNSDGSSTSSMIPSSSPLHLSYLRY